MWRWKSRNLTVEKKMAFQRANFGQSAMEEQWKNRNVAVEERESTTGRAKPGHVAKI